MKHLVLLFLFVILIFPSCNIAPVASLSPSLCQRNVYSRNGVDSVLTYEYNAKEGVIDMSSKTLQSLVRYDSLGNITYYRGKYYPSIVDFADFVYHYEIRDELDLPWDMVYSYKMDYTDSTLNKASVFDESGRYIARIEESRHGNKVEDSVYVSNKVIYVRHIFKDTEMRDSVTVSYDNNYSRQLSLAEEEKSSFRKEGNTVYEKSIYKSRDIFFRQNHKYESHSSEYATTYDDYGRVIKIVNLRDGGTTVYNRNENGQILETTTEMSYGNYLYKHEYYENGLEKCSYRYQDGNVLLSYTEYEYSFHPYSKSN